LPHLVRISEALVLLVRHGRPRLGRAVDLLVGLRGVATSLVLPDIVGEQGESGQHAARKSTHDGNLGRAVVGRIACLEGLGADDVADREGAADDGRGKGALGRSGDIGGNQLFLSAGFGGGERIGLTL